MHRHKREQLNGWGGGWGNGATVTVASANTNNHRDHLVWSVGTFLFMTDGKQREPALPQHNEMKTLRREA